jgi:hypothetical protein
MHTVQLLHIDFMNVWHALLIIKGTIKVWHSVHVIGHITTMKKQATLKTVSDMIYEMYSNFPFHTFFTAVMLK